jgi:putative FmdB family regulatory protein
MPLYEYECPTHGRYEVTQRISDTVLTKCGFEGCDQPVRKLLSSGAFSMNGTGGRSRDDSGTSSCAGGTCGTGLCSIPG